MRTSVVIAFLVVYGLHDSAKAQSPLPLSSNPAKTEITLNNGTMYPKSVLFLLKDSSILISNSLVKEDYIMGNYELRELYINDIQLVSKRRLGGPTGGALAGALVGFSAGFAIGYIQGDGFFTAEQTGWILGAAGAGIGAISGAVFCSFKVKIPIHGSMENYNREKKKLGRYTVKYQGSPRY